MPRKGGRGMPPRRPWSPPVSGTQRDDHAVQQHLEGEREEGEIDFLEPHADRADDEPQRPRTSASVSDEGGRYRHAGPLHQQRERVGAEPEEHAVAERDHAAVADQKIERGREQAERRAADHEIDQRLAAARPAAATPAWRTRRRRSGDRRRASASACVRRSPCRTGRSAWRSG